MNLFSSEIPPGVFWSLFFKRYEAMPIEIAITEVSNVSARAETGLPMMSETVVSAR